MEHLKVLIVDDSLDHLITLANYLTEINLELTILKAPNAQTALKLAKSKMPDLIITDWEMPEISGIELIEELKREELTKEIPVIMCTGAMTSSTNLAAALKAGAIDYIRKPIDKIELHARVNSIMLLNRYHKEKLSAEAERNQLLLDNIEKQKKQLLVTTMNVVNQNAQLGKIKSQLEEISKNKLVLSDIYSLIKFIDKFQEADRNWEQFKFHFEQVHESFFHTINSRFPNLTRNEKRLCAYYRINLSTDEIAQIQNVTKDAVKKSRYRLRKKLLIEPDEDIVPFFEKI